MFHHIHPNLRSVHDSHLLDLQEGTSAPIQQPRESLIQFKTQVFRPQHILLFNSRVLLPPT